MGTQTINVMVVFANLGLPFPSRVWNPSFTCLFPTPHCTVPQCCTTCHSADSLCAQAPFLAAACVLTRPSLLSHGLPHCSCHSGNLGMQTLMLYHLVPLGTEGKPGSSAAAGTIGGAVPGSPKAAVWRALTITKRISSSILLPRFQNQFGS